VFELTGRRKSSCRAVGFSVLCTAACFGAQTKLLKLVGGPSQSTNVSAKDSGTNAFILIRYFFTPNTSRYSTGNLTASRSLSNSI
jgi:hypothetical protein